VLDGIGLQIADIAAPGAPPLIRKVHATDPKKWTWCTQADYFILKSQKKSTFAELYG
jgi:hypothetical protein